MSYELSNASQLLLVKKTLGLPTSYSFINRLRNPSFAINQRSISGTVVLSAGQYGHDGVKAGAAGATYTFSTSGLDTTINISAGSLILPIEAALIEGGVYSLSHAGTAQARVWQGTGSTGSGSYVGAPFATSSLSANTQTNVEFSTGTVICPQLEIGSYVTAFARRQADVELALCQRYFQTCFASHLATATAATQFFGGAISLVLTMRATPTLSALSGGSMTNMASDGLNTMGASAVRYYFVSTATGAVEAYNRAFTASAEI